MELSASQWATFGTDKAPVVEETPMNATAAASTTAASSRWSAFAEAPVQETSRGFCIDFDSATAPSAGGEEGAPPPVQLSSANDLLSDDQRAAATASAEEPMAIIAGAGSGKTLTLVSRVAAMINAGVAPRGVLLLTFSKAAAAEMGERLQGGRRAGAAGGGADVPRLQPRAAAAAAARQRPEPDAQLCRLLAERVKEGGADEPRPGEGLRGHDAEEGADDRGRRRRCWCC